MSTSKIDRDDLLKLARQHFDAGHRPIPVAWPDGRLQPLVKSYGEFFVREMTDADFDGLFLRNGEVRRNIEGFGILTGPKTGVVGIDIDVKNGLDGFAWLKGQGITVPRGLKIKTPHNGIHVASGWPDGVDVLPKGDVGNIVNGSGDNRVGVEIKAAGDLFIVYGPGYRRQNGIGAIGRSKLNGRVLEICTGDWSPDDDDEFEFEVPEEQEPAPLDAAIPKRGYLADIVNFFTQTTDVPPEYALSVGIAQLSALMTGRIAVEAWGDVIRSHMWIVFVSGPASRKTHSWKIGLRILSAVDRGLQIPSDSTVPALIQFISEERPDEANGFIFHSEMKRFLESCQQSWQAGTQDFMSELFDSLDDVGELRMTREANVIHNPSVSIMGALTDAGFAKYARTSAILDGYLTRFVFIFRESGPIKGHGRRAAQTSGAKFDAIVKGLKGRYKLIRRVSGKVTTWPHIVQFTDAADTIFETFNDQLKDEKVDRGVEGFRDRLMTQVLKLAMCYAASRAKDADDFEIREADVRHAIAFMEYERSRAWDIIAMAAETQTRTAEYRMELRVRTQELQKKQAEEEGTDWTKEWVPKRDLQRSLKNVTARGLDGYIDTLEQAGEMRVKKKGAEKTRYRGGRPSVLVRLTPQGWVRDRWKVG